MERFVCIHGHFYQPPRENPWLEAVELQDSAFPYHDWNERITAECYAPNTASRQLDGDQRITNIVSNYARMSFNFGPTLLSWMEKYSPEVYAAILAADRQSMEWRSGHGSAIAQVYNHIIMPLAKYRDKETQVLWGIRDFQHRFGRFPEGMWLAETAVDTETLEVMAKAGIRFTILAPRQAAQVRKIGKGDWKDVSGARIDPSRAYLCRLPSGRRISIFFYDGPISQAVAFEKLLDNGEYFASRLMSGFTDQRRRAQLVHIATDGETYGHHHVFGEMALGHALNHIEKNSMARLTNYGEFLALHPPIHEVRIIDNSSWSCMHGIERWRNDCGCNSGGHSGWNQQWRRPLRDALDQLSSHLDICFEKVANEYLADPWAARNEYIDVMLDRSEENVAKFLKYHSLQPLDEDDTVIVLCMLEMQRHCMLMYTSCGWFFDEFSGIETVQVLQYAARAIQLAEKHCENEIEEAFLANLALAFSNIPEYGNGADIYTRFVKPAMIDLIKVGAHYAVSSVFENYDDETEIFSYRISREDFHTLSSGQIKLAAGRIFIRSKITRKADWISFCCLYFGGHALNGGVRSYLGEEPYQTMMQEIANTFEEGDFASIIRLMNIHFGMHNYSLKNLFRDEQRLILQRIIENTLHDFEDRFISLYENSRSLMGFLRETSMPVPRHFMTTAEIALNLELHKVFSSDEVDVERVSAIISEMANWGFQIDDASLEPIIRHRLEESMTTLLNNRYNEEMLIQITRLVEVIVSLPIKVNLWQVQNVYWTMTRPQRYEPLDMSIPSQCEEKLITLGRLLYFSTS